MLGVTLGVVSCGGKKANNGDIGVHGEEACYRRGRARFGPKRFWISGIFDPISLEFHYVFVFFPLFFVP